ncbi:MAG TPA: hypothetical protein VJR47_15060 [Stellaceae bacterium]|nr:hypothetical protein [Stellaceae bacterium]
MLRIALPHRSSDAMRYLPHPERSRGTLAEIAAKMQVVETLHEQGASLDFARDEVKSEMASTLDARKTFTLDARKTFASS